MKCAIALPVLGPGRLRWRHFLWIVGELSDTLGAGLDWGRWLTCPWTICVETRGTDAPAP